MIYRRNASQNAPGGWQPKGGYRVTSEDLAPASAMPSNVCVLLQFYNERNLRWHTHTLKYITHNNTTHSLDRTSSNLIGWPYACHLQDSGLLQWLLLEGLITGFAKVCKDCDIKSFIWALSSKKARFLYTISLQLGRRGESGNGPGSNVSFVSFEYHSLMFWRMCTDCYATATNFHQKILKKSFVFSL